MKKLVCLSVVLLLIVGIADAVATEPAGDTQTSIASGVTDKADKKAKDDGDKKDEKKVAATMKRCLIKVSGEALSGADRKFDLKSIRTICNNIKNVIDEGIRVSIVVGGGNIIRGRDFKDSSDLNSETADAAGMFATVVNGMILRDALRSIGLDAEIVSTLNLPLFDIKPNDSFTISKLVKKNKIIIFCGGVGLPYFSTDTIAVVAAFMSDCDMILKSTKTDGVYDKDPMIHKDAKHIPELTYRKAIEKSLEIMDKTAFALAEKKKLPIHIFSQTEPNCYLKAIKNEIKQSTVR